MYALARNAWKYVDRDKRTERIQHLEYDYLAPDTINEMFHTLHLLETHTGYAYYKAHHPKKNITQEEAATTGKQLLHSDPKLVNQLEITIEGVENSKRKTILTKVTQAYALFTDLIYYYGITQLLQSLKQQKAGSFESFIAALPAKSVRTNWINIGGQLIMADDRKQLKGRIKSGKIKSWYSLHD